MFGRQIGLALGAAFGLRGGCRIRVWREEFLLTF
jgi:hypothetical protein